jgi:hypothetical protein
MTAENLSVAQREAARAAAMSDLRDVRLFSAELNFDHFPPTDQPLSWSLEMTPAVQYEADAAFFVLDMAYRVDVTEVQRDDEVEGEGEKFASLSFRMAALYDLRVPDDSPRPTVSELDAYAKTMGTLALYPYAREFVQSMTSRMGLPPLTMSTLRLPYPDTSEPPSLPLPTEPTPIPTRRARKPRSSPNRTSKGKAESA